MRFHPIADLCVSDRKPSSARKGALSTGKAINTKSAAAKRKNGRLSAAANRAGSTRSIETTTIDTVIDVYTGDCATGLVSVACNDDSCGSRSELTFDAVQGVEYFVRIGSASELGCAAVDLLGFRLQSVLGEH